MSGTILNVGVLIMIKIKIAKNYLFVSNPLSLMKSLIFALDIGAHFSNLSMFEYETDSPTECKTSTRSCDCNTRWTDSSIAKRSGDKYPLFLQNCIGACATAIFWSSFFFCCLSLWFRVYHIKESFQWCRYFNSQLF